MLFINFLAKKMFITRITKKKYDAGYSLNIRRRALYSFFHTYRAFNAAKDQRFLRLLRQHRQTRLQSSK